MAKKQDNGTRVTIAIVNTKVEYIVKTMDEIKRDSEQTRRESKEFRERVYKRVNTNENEITKVKERQSIWNYGLTALNVIIGGIAAFLGVRK